MVGTNNTGQYKGRQTPQETAEGIREIASRIHRLHPATEIILLHIFPRGKTAEDPLRIQNEMINRELDKTNMPRVHVVNNNSAFLDKDGTFLPGITGHLVHQTEKANRLWAHALLPQIKKHEVSPLPPSARLNGQFGLICAEAASQSWLSLPHIKNRRDYFPSGFRIRPLIPFKLA